MAQNEANNINKVLNICKANGESFYGLKLRKYSVESVVMSLGDKISGDVLYQSNDLPFTMQEYVEYEGVKYYLVNPPTVVREGLVKDNSGLNGMTKYSLTFYHPMYMLGNFPFSDIAVTSSQEKYLSQNKSFSWIGNLFDFIAKLNKNLETTEWYVSTNITQESNQEEYNKAIELSDVLSFNNNFISDALKTAYDTWEIPFTITSKTQTVDGVQKKYLIEFGMPNEEILEDDEPFVFRFGQGVGLKNNSRTPKNNKIVTRIIGSGSERNIPFGYPQVRWGGQSGLKFTYGDRVGVFTDVTIVVGGESHHLNKLISYPIYKGILGGAYVELIKHPYTRDSLMPSVYYESIFNKVSFLNVDGSFNENYNPDAQIIDYYDARSDQDYVFPHEINPNAPSTEIHQFEDIYPRLGDKTIVSAVALNAKKNSGKLIEVISKSEFGVILNDLIDNETDTNVKTMLIELRTNVIDNNPTAYVESNSETHNISYYYKLLEYDTWEISFTSSSTNFFYYVSYSSSGVAWDDSMDDNGEYKQSYFKITLPATLDFDLYACASITEQMQINMRSGACIGCTFEVQVDWEDYKKNFYHEDGTFDPEPHESPNDGHIRDITKYPNSYQNSIDVICKKDLDTFGVLMPNMYQSPSAGDKFVILGISLPYSYIENAQDELDDKAKQYMLENNDYYYEYPLKFDEHFLVTHQDILAQIKNNSAIHFLYTNEEITLYVKQIVIKYGEGVLPQWNITLTDDIDVVLNKIGQAAEDVRGLQQQVTNLEGDMSTTKNNFQVISNNVHGQIGKFYYYAGEWSSSSTKGYSVNDTQAPYFLYIRDNSQPEKKEYWLFNPDKNGVYTPTDMGTPNSTTYGWQPMTSEFKYLISDALFSQFAHLGSAIISGDWLISQHGTINGVASTNYIAFDPTHPNDNITTNFIPNYCVDLLTGTSYQHNAHIDGKLYSTQGQIGGFVIGIDSIGDILGDPFYGSRIYSAGGADFGNTSEFGYALRTSGKVELAGNGKDIIINTTTGDISSHANLVFNGYAKIISLPRVSDPHFNDLVSGSVYIDNGFLKVKP